MGKLNKLKSRLGFGVGWDAEYLQEDEAVSNPGVDAGAGVGMDAGAGAGAYTPNPPEGASLGLGTGSPDAYGAGAQDRCYSYESPYASGAAPSAVTKHVRKPDLRRASQASGSKLRDVPDSAPALYAQQNDGLFRIQPKHFSEASIIADQFRSGTVVSMDLTLTSVNQRQRFIDFAAGLVYALDGHLARSANHVYVLTPRK